MTVGVRTAEDIKAFVTLLVDQGQPAVQPA